MADNIETLVDVGDDEKIKTPEKIENYEKIRRQTTDLTNLLSLLKTAGDDATKMLFERVLKIDNKSKSNRQ